MYYSAGAVYDPVAIEKALRVRCAHLHLDEKKLTTRPSYKDKEEENKPWSYKKKKIIVKKRMHGTHTADQEEVDAEASMEPEDEEDDELPPDPLEEEEMPDDDEDNETTDGELEDGELKEAFAAGWKAKQKVADIKKNRGWKQNKKGDKGASIDARKKATTCSSCGKTGHWRGDPECANVINGRDQPHKKGKASTVHFTFMVGTEKQCPQCFGPRWSPPSSVVNAAVHCLRTPACQLAAREMEKRVGKKWKMTAVNKQTVVGAKPKPTAKSKLPSGQVTLQGQELMAAIPSMSRE